MQQSLFYFLYAKHTILTLQVSNKLHPAKTLSILSVPPSTKQKVHSRDYWRHSFESWCVLQFYLANPSQNGVQNMFLTLKNAERNSDIHGDALSTILTPPLTV